MEVSPGEEKRFTAFILDDNFDNRQIFRVSLESVEFDVTDCGDPIEALVLLQQRTFDVLVLDLQMPTMNGQTVLNNLRELPIHNDMHVVVVTANPHMAIDGLISRGDYLLYKPIDVTQFAMFVERLKRAPRLA